MVDSYFFMNNFRFVHSRRFLTIEVVGRYVVGYLPADYPKPIKHRLEVWFGNNG